MNLKKLSSLLFASVLCLSPLGIQANTTYATSEDGSQSYTSIDSAWLAAQNGTIIVMQTDWNLSNRLVLDNSKVAIVDMNGHKISRNLTSSKTNGEVIKMCANSTLTLKGEKASNTTFNFKGYADGILTDVSITSGGLVTGGYSTNGAGGIHMKSGSVLNLYSVSISGNKSDQSWGSDGHGGAIYMDGEKDQIVMNNAQIAYNAVQENGGGIYVNNKNSSIKMDSHSLITKNSAGANIEGLGIDTAKGGGIAIDADNVTVTLSNGSSICENYAHAYGGGIYSNAKNTKIYLNNSSINSNTSHNRGGGIYFEYSNFEVSSEKKDGQISYNKSEKSKFSGGGIFAERCILSSNQGKIDGITFTGNESYRGGALAIHQENVTVSNCTFTQNTADYAAAIDIQNDDFILENSTVQYNTTTNAKNYGAVNVDSFNDITFSGVVTIKNNPNTIRNYDADLSLQSESWQKAYLLNTPDASSKIGLLIDDDRTLGKNQTSNVMNMYYVNNSEEYTISFNESSKEIVSEEQPETKTIDISEQSEENQDEQTTDVQEDIQTYTVTLNMVNEAGTWQNTQKTTLDSNEPFELQAPVVEDKTFVEFKEVPENFTVEDNIIRADSISEDIEITLVYRDEESENLETGSIFGDGNVSFAVGILVGILAIGVISFLIKKKKSC